MPETFVEAGPLKIRADQPVPCPKCSKKMTLSVSNDEHTPQVEWTCETCRIKKMTRMRHDEVIVEEDLELVPLRDVPQDQWFRMNLKGTVLRATTRKLNPTGGRNGDQVLEISPHELVWWVKNYAPRSTEM